MTGQAPPIDPAPVKVDRGKGAEIGQQAEVSQLENAARQLGESHASVRRDGGEAAISRSLGEFRQLFLQAVQYFRKVGEQELAHSYAAEWMLDNYYLIQQAMRQIEEDLPSGFYHELPKLIGGPLDGFPRIYALAREVILVEKAHLDMDRVQRFIHAYQAVTVLTMGELWALPIMLRLGTLQSLELAIARITGLGSEEDRQELPKIDFSGLLKDDEVVANCIISLRLLSVTNWKETFESLSVVESILRRDPAGYYSGMDFETRDRYRKVVEDLAFQTGKEEQVLAREAVRLAQAGLDQISAKPGWRSDGVDGFHPPMDGFSSLVPGPDGPVADPELKEWPGFGVPAEAHTGTYLLGKGRAKLESSIGYRPVWYGRAGRSAMSHPTAVYLGSITGLTFLLLSLLVGFTLNAGGEVWQLVLSAFLGLIPALTVAIKLVNWVLTKAVKPRVLPKMDFSDNLPADCLSLVVIPALLTSPDEVRSLLQQIELHYLRNLSPSLYFALLTDFTDALQQHLPEDEELLKQASEGVDQLNAKYPRESGNPFLLLHRERRWNPAEGLWIGWERKRGKLHELNLLILGKAETSYSTKIGDLSVLPEVKYVITLDADTILPNEGAARLIATLAHPLNRAVFDLQEEKVVAGYTILQPRTEINPSSASQSWFTRIFAGDTGLDLYTLAVSEVYQDLFGEGIYVGKGIYDVRAFERSLYRSIPENTLLSHDLFEGIYGRAGLATDIILIEDYPPNYLAYIQRLHRWVRGDWQLLPWLFPLVPSLTGLRLPNRLKLIDRWKIFENLQRSLVSPSLLLFFIIGWLWMPGPPWAWTVFGVLSLSMPFMIDFVSAFARLLTGANWRRQASDLRDSAVRWLLSLAFLPYEAFLDLDAILTTLARLLVTRKGMLQWTTSAQSARVSGEELSSRVSRKRMAISLLLSITLALILALYDIQALVAAAPLLVLWLFSPEIAYWLSRPISHLPQPLSGDERDELRSLACMTWLFFEQFVGPEDHWLPPDHFQEHPLGVVSHRTSPTNIGLALLSALAAYDFGYIGLLDLAARLQSSFESMGKLQRYRGHLLNWYDTHTLDPLPPSYVSTVDSGNLAACLITLGQGCLAMERAQVLRWEDWEGLLDALALLAGLIEDLEDEQVASAAAGLREQLASIRLQILALDGAPDDWMPRLNELSGEGWNELDRRLLSFVEENGAELGTENLVRLRIFARRVRHHLDGMAREVNLLLPWLEMIQQPPALLGNPGIDPVLLTAWGDLIDSLARSPKLNEIEEIAKSGRAQTEALKLGLERQQEVLHVSPESIRATVTWLDRLAGSLDSAAMTAKGLLIGYREVYRQAEDYVREMDFKFLFSAERKLFHIGYNLTLSRLDTNYYDLLETEARIASFIAIAKGDVPQSHWLHLGRPLAKADRSRILLSWYGTMFEFLMPNLLLRSYPGTLLHHSADGAVISQIAYGKEKNVPWGISESGYYRFDVGMEYQYRAFGVPGLGFERGLKKDLVISPYASMLALLIHPQEVMKNIAELKQLEAVGTYGFYESIDFTKARLATDRSYEIVREYMAHHQGMILLSLANYEKGEIMVDRFHADPRVQGVDLLLQEQIPHNAPVEEAHTEDERALISTRSEVVTTPWRKRVLAPYPQAHFLSNGRYRLLVTSSGGGYSTWKEIDLTRWKEDTTLNNWGTWIYIQDRDNGSLWSASYQPTAVSPHRQDVYFSPHMAEFRRRDQEISSVMEITVAPEEDVEIRRITLTNHSENPRRLRLTSYGEVILSPHATDLRHPAFNKLFIESQYLSRINAVLFHRRPRTETEKPIYLLHTLVVDDRQTVTGLHETDRERFLGRYRTVRSPASLSGQDLPRGGENLDPILSLTQYVDLDPHESCQVAFLTIAAGSRGQALALADRYQAWRMIERAFDQASSRAEVELRQLGLSSVGLDLADRLLSRLIYPSAALRAPAATLQANTKGQPGLWAFGISGDFPILLVKVESQDDLLVVQELLQAHTYWRNHGIKIDLVVLNMQGTDYGQELNTQLHRLLVKMNSDAWINRRGGIFTLLIDQIAEEDRVLLETAARVVLEAKAGALADQLVWNPRQPARLPPLSGVLPPDANDAPTPPLERPDGLHFDQGLGGFSPDGREYLIYLEPEEYTPAPWINVIANPQFGFLVSEAGSGSTWAINSGENRLTPWSNDPVTDPPGEAVYLRDEETAEVWSPTPLPARAQAPYLVRHGAGYSVFEHHSHGLKQRLRLFAAREDPVKMVQLRLENTLASPRRITATYYVEWVLGVTREPTQQYVIPEFDNDSQALLARNAYHVEFGGRVAFAAGSKPLHGLTADRTEFLGRMGSLESPSALRRIGLSGKVEAGYDPCAALQLHLDLQPGETQEVYFLLGQGADRDDALRLVKKYQEESQVEAAWEDLTGFWEGLLGTVQVRTPEPGMDLLLNRWLLYQTLACRYWGRSGFYQSSGAYGFHDQLQDVMALAFAAPELTRDHLLRAARQQFEAGDVLHWWHPPSGRGVRTRISDDLVWLPYVAAYYVLATGDESVLAEQMPFLQGPPLEPGQAERYQQYQTSNEVSTLFEHCRRALDKATTSGPHGLPLIGAGDWNDGMNLVGREGRGESVWLGWFLYDNLVRFSGVCERQGNEELAEFYRERAEELDNTLEEHAWDGDWYRRAYYDDGAPLGSAANRECRIDSIAQSWAVLSGAGDLQRSVTAMRSVLELLVRPEEKLVLLFTPPFNKTPHDPGYIKSYLPGIRENGGQYTHAALWAAWAFAQLGDGDQAEGLFRLLNPIHHADTPERMRTYKVEPYVVAADIYSEPPYQGRGGWTWYTGSSSWMYRLGLEAILGLRLENGLLKIDPCIPKNWPGYEITVRRLETTFHIQVENPSGVNRGVREIMMDGERLDDGLIPLVEDGKEHKITVRLGA